MSQIKKFPYTPLGYNNYRQALASTVQAMGSYGAWVAGVVLSSAEIVEVNTQAARIIAPTLQTQGWYLLVADPGPVVRAAGGTPIVQFYYTDGGSRPCDSAGNVTDVE